MSNINCVCTTPDVFPAYQKNWQSLDALKIPYKLIVDISKDKIEYPSIFGFTEADIRKNLNFNKDVSKNHWWNHQGNRNIVWFYAHFRMLNFYLQHPNYDYYWFFDDDVIVTDWTKFFAGFENDNSDFISHFCFKNVGVVDQRNIPVIDSNTCSGELWFQRFPGTGDILPNSVNKLFGSFFDIVRFSNRALEELAYLNYAGYSGYSEGFVPTMLNASGMNLNTILKADNTSDFIDVTKVELIHKGIKTNWQWI